MAAYSGLILLGTISLTLLAAVFLVPRFDADLSMRKASTVYYSDGTTVLGRFHESDGNTLSLEDLPANSARIVRAVFSSDPRTVSDLVVDVKGMASTVLRGEPYIADSLAVAAVLNVNGTPQGRTHALQSYIQMLQASWLREDGDLIASLLTFAPFGRGCYGLEQAATAYFQHGTDELSPSKLVLLLALVPDPNSADPALYPEEAKLRWEALARTLVEEGLMTPAEVGQMPAVVEASRSDGWDGPTGYLLALVEEELNGIGITRDTLISSGMKIITTFDASLQDSAGDLVRSLPAERTSGNRVARW